MARPDPHDEVEALDAEFVHHLDRGADLLSRGQPEAALAPLERARDLRPRDPQVLGLLGQALYKLGRFDPAAEAYQRLVDESPIEPSARVNLGLSHLKAKRYPQAVRQLEVALDLSPDHRKAMGYLGLAWLEQGDPARARGWFERAGSHGMVVRCDELMAKGDAATSPPVEGAPAMDGGASPEVAPVQGPAGGEPEPPGAPGSGFVTTRTLGASAAQCFALEGGILTVAVRADVLSRAQGLLAVRGAVRLTPEMKRFRGRATEKPFGDGKRRLLRASGEGALLYVVEGRRLARLDLKGEPAYFREEAVFAFEDALAFENGRVASRGAPDLHLVHLQGSGQLLLATSGDVIALDVARDVPLRLGLGALLGWTGVLTPRLGVLARGSAAESGGGGDAGEPVMVELSGEGRVLLDGGAAA